MTETDPVQVIVEIIDQFSDEIAKLKSELESIDDLLDVFLVIDDAGQIDLTEQELDHLSRDRLVNLYVVTHGDEDLGGGGAGINLPDGQTQLTDLVYGGSAFTNRRVRSATRQATLDEFLPDPSLLQRITDWAAQAKNHVTELLTAEPDGRSPMEILGDGFRRVIPTWHKYIQLVSLLLPLLISLGVAAAGAAAAMGTVALAGAGILGLGLIGEADDLETALERATDRISEFMEELHGVFLPTSQIFQPIAEQFLDTAPHRMQDLARAMESLIVFADSFNDAFDGLVNWLERGVRGAAELEKEIETLALRFGSITGDAIARFLRWLVVEVYENQDAFIQLGSTFVDVLQILYNLAKVFSFVVSSLEPFFSLLVTVTEWLDNRFVVALMSTMVAGFGVAKMGFMVKNGINAMIAGFAALRAAVMAANAQLSLFHILTGGLALVAAGIAGYGAMKLLTPSNSPPDYGDSGFGAGSGMTGAGGDSYTLNVYGDVSNRHLRKFEDIASSTYDEREEFGSETAWPQ